MRQRIFLPVIATGILLVGWEVLMICFPVPLVPRVSEVMAYLPAVVVDSYTFRHLAVSVWLVTEGYLLSVACALPLAVVCSRQRSLSSAILPFHEFVRYIPVPAFVPLLQVFLGIGASTKVGIIFLGTYFQVLFLFIADLSSLPKGYEDSARTLGLGEWQLIWRVLVPGAAPALLSSARISFGWAWSYLLVAEVVNAKSGIGFLILQAYRVLDMPRLVSLLLVTGLFGLVADRGFRCLARYLCPWREAVGE